MEKSLIVKEFEGKQVVTLFWEGRPCWIANEIASVFGYDKVRDVVQNCITTEEFELGVEYDILSGERLRAFKGANIHSSKIFGQAYVRSPQLTIFYEDGLYGFLQYTDKPAGKRFRKWLRREVIPEIRRRGYYALPGRGAGECEASHPWTALLREHLEAAKMLIEGSGVKPNNAYTAAIEAAERETGRSLEPYKKLFSQAAAKSEEKPVTTTTEEEILNIVRDYINKNRERIYGFGAGPAETPTNPVWVGAKSKVNKEECIVLFERSLAKALTQHNLDIVQVKKALKSAGLIITRREGRKERFGIKIHKRDLQGSGLAFPVNSLFLH